MTALTSSLTPCHRCRQAKADVARCARRLAEAEERDRYVASRRLALSKAQAERAAHNDNCEWALVPA